jgi:hypothetical protein
MDADENCHNGQVSVFRLDGRLSWTGRIVLRDQLAHVPEIPVNEPRVITGLIGELGPPAPEEHSSLQVSRPNTIVRVEKGGSRQVLFPVSTGKSEAV